MHDDIDSTKDANYIVDKAVGDIVAERDALRAELEKQKLHHYRLTDASAGIIERTLERLAESEKECTALRNEIADLREAGNRLDGALDMQLKRESGEFRITQQAALAVVVEARLLWAKATPHIKDGEKR